MFNFFSRKYLLTFLFIHLTYTSYSFPQKQFLSVEETMKLTKGRPSNSSCWHLYQKANPQAKDLLWEYVKNKQNIKKENIGFAGAFRCLGFIGNKKDLDKIITYYHKHFDNSNINKQFSGNGSDVLYGICDALGIMAKRNMPKAKHQLKRMLTISYWEVLKTQMYSSKTLEKVGEHFKYDILLPPFQAYALCASDKELDKAATNIEAALKNNPKALERIKFYLSSKRKSIHKRADSIFKKKSLISKQASINSSNIKKDKKPKLLPNKSNEKNYTGDSSTNLENIKNDAIKSYEKILQEFKKKNTAYIFDKLADNGRPICTKETRVNMHQFKSKRFLQALDETIFLIKAVGEVSHQYGPMEITITNTQKFACTNSDYAKKDSHQRIVVTIPLLGTYKLAQKLRLHNSPHPPKIINNNGNILITMIFENGAWYWNPFGW